MSLTSAPEMKTVIKISSILHDGAITGRHCGRVMREAVASAFVCSDEVVLDFSGVEMITQSAADEFIGRIMRENPGWISQIQFNHCDEAVREMIQWSAAHADSVRQHAEFVAA